MRPPKIRAFGLAPDELVIDLFAGGGGASTGIEAAIDRPVDIAINHDEAAIAMHKQNHPETQHYREDIWAVSPREACGSRRPGLLWLSPDCTHHSRAKGGQPRRKEIRSLADVGIRWAEEVRPRMILLENVEEFEGWGPLDENGKIIADKKGEDFRAWCGRLSTLGYRIEYRSLVAADYGAPTTRKRLFLVARCDGGPIVWPEAMYGRGRSRSWRAAAEILDWSLPCPSIFGRAKPLVEATMRRIAEGIRRYVIEAGEPFIVRHGHYSTITGAGLYDGCGAGTFRGQRVTEPLATVCATNDKHVVIPLVTRHYGGGPNGNQSGVARSVQAPLATVTAVDHHALTAAFLTKFYGTSTGSPVQLPLPTVTAGGGKGGGHIGEVRAFLLKYYGGTNGKPQQQGLFEPLHTVTSKARFGLVMVHGEPYEIVDIGMRMLAPHELFAAQGFPETYDITPELHGKPITKTAQIALAGNSVSPPVAEALVRANVYERQVHAA